MSGNQATLDVNRLRHSYEDRVIFHRVGFSWTGPGIICVCGPNGSGKTTLLSMLGGACVPDEGDILVLGRSMRMVRGQILPLLSYVPDACPVYPFVTGREWLDFVQAARRPAISTAPDLVRRFGLVDSLELRFSAMSLGTARKLMLAAGLGTQAPITVLDEPTNGLDAAARDVLREQLLAIAASRLVVMCCHDVGEQRALGARCVELASLETA
ncbi:ABC transporter ATP-binding protein [Verminephrobacter aporrectodeae subsp. tuberculatae]|uniref:ABC transporter ATP-binding protein n=1 Tax=Verminephrobacter aporrectodeae TaxID=1110389 RepID=UPI002242E750|nr:ATP-binding cassette domain-containing protein [Verminephrobacter aporrectodeae]MCW8198614.1 ABC transporter ATP-binding protein [Verminephrobacter aporrectodeae subsp. tuberculatae]